MNKKAGGAAFYDGEDESDTSFLEAKQWIEAIRNDTNPTVLPEQALVITQSLRGSTSPQRPVSRTISINLLFLKEKVGKRTFVQLRY